MKPTCLLCWYQFDTQAELGRDRRPGVWKRFRHGPNTEGLG